MIRRSHSAATPRRALSVLATIATTSAATNLQAGTTPLDFLLSLQTAPRLVASTDSKHENKDYVWLEPGERKTVAEHSGACIVVRIWFTGSRPEELRVMMTVDGRPTSLSDRGRLRWPLKSSVAAVDGEAYWSFAPVGVSKEFALQVENLTSERAKFFYQVGLRPGPWAPAQVQALRQLMEAVSAPDWPHALPATHECPGDGVLELRGPAVIQALRFRWDGWAEHNARLVADFDGRRCIEAPIRDMFGQTYGEVTFRSLMMSVQPPVWALNAPMPFRESARIYVEGAPSSLVRISAAVEPATGASDGVHIAATAVATPTTDGQPLTLLDVRGRGVLLGTMMAYQAIAQRTFAALEGNETIEVDGQRIWEGTGTEDYFNGAWYFQHGQVRRPLHGVLYRREHPHPRVIAYRWHLSDAVPFQRSLRFTMGHGGTNRQGPAPHYYRFVTLWYAANETEPDVGDSSPIPQPHAFLPAAPQPPHQRPWTLAAWCLVIALGLVGLKCLAAVVSSHRKRK